MKQANQHSNQNIAQDPSTFSQKQVSDDLAQLQQMEQQLGLQEKKGLKTTGESKKEIPQEQQGLMLKNPFVGE